MDSKRKYTFKDDSWVDGSEDCPCCSGLTFECYNLIDCPDEVESIVHYHSASATSEHDMLSSVLMMESDVEYVVGGNPYEHLTLQELKDVLSRLNVEVEIL